MNKFPRSVGWVRGILEINNVYYTVGTKGISTLNNEVYNIPFNERYDWCETCRVGNNILVICCNSYGNDDGECRLFNPINCKWSDVDIRTKRRRFAVVYYLDKIFIIGGLDGRQALNSIGVYDPVSKTLVSSPIKMNEARCGHKVIAYKKKLFVFGGYDKDGRRLNSVEMFSPQTNTFVVMAPMKIARCDFACCRVGNLVYVVGGSIGDVFDRTKSVEMFSPVTKKFVMMAPMKIARNGFACCRIGNLVYVVGGSIGVCLRTNSVEIYNLDNNTWTDGVDFPISEFGLYACAVNDKLISTN